MHYCINSLLEINNEIMQYCIIINDIALIMHYHALLKGSDYNIIKNLVALELDGTPSVYVSV